MKRVYKPHYQVSILLCYMIPMLISNFCVHCARATDGSIHITVVILAAVLTPVEILIGSPHQDLPGHASNYAVFSDACTVIPPYESQDSFIYSIQIQFLLTDVQCTCYRARCFITGYLSHETDTITPANKIIHTQIYQLGLHHRNQYLAIATHRPAVVALQLMRTAKFLIEL